jgi:DNA-binding transcriptional ArsR family regulator
MTSQSGFVEVAALAGEAGMLHALMDGRALTASELARVAGITPQTASGHLARLAVAGLLAVEKQGRHRYHRLASLKVRPFINGGEPGFLPFSIGSVSACCRSKTCILTHYILC